jgi:hypothetical protein
MPSSTPSQPRCVSANLTAEGWTAATALGLGTEDGVADLVGVGDSDACKLGDGAAGLGALDDAGPQQASTAAITSNGARCIVLTLERPRCSDF